MTEPPFAARQPETGSPVITRRRLIGTSAAFASLGVTTVALPASAEFNSYIGPTEPSGEALAGEQFFFGQVSGGQFRVSWVRAQGSASPATYTFQIEAYFIPTGIAAPVSNPFSFGTANTIPWRNSVYNVFDAGTVVKYIAGSSEWDGGYDKMYPNLDHYLSAGELDGTRFRAILTSVEPTPRTVSVPMVGYDIGDRWT